MFPMCLGICLAGITAALVGAADQTLPGAGNARAEEIGRASPLVSDSMAILIRNIENIRDERLRKVTLDALSNVHTCIAHRAHLTANDKNAIIQQLTAKGLLSASDASGIEGGGIAGVFPPVLEDGGACPHCPLSLEAAPGSEFDGHHSFPGGLAVHESFNQQNAANLAALYRRTYAVGLAQAIDEDLVLAAPAWHDWAKTFVFQWNVDGTEFQELKFGGQGKNDNFGKAGDSRTGAHHILGLAETMARGLPPALVITQASAHAAPTLGNEYKVVNWIRAAAIIARVDPIAKGYLRNSDGHLRLPDMRIEYQIHNLSDADFVNSIPAVALADSLLKQMASRFGYDPANVADYNNRFRNVVLAHLGAERIEMIDAEAGISGVVAEVEKLRKAKVI
jgi:hypothetical protein